MDSIPSIPEKALAPGDRFVPAPDLAEWTQATFIDQEGPLAHERHEHLRYARIGMLWTSAEYTRKGRTVLGKAETGIPPGVYGWHRDRMEQQVRRWFSGWFDGAEPDFVITLYGPYVAERLDEGDARSVCALIEHELCHCAQKKKDGVPQFSDDGRPQWAIEGHDVEVFVHEVRRYGAYSDQLRALESALQEVPTTEEKVVRGACGCGAPVTA